MTRMAEPENRLDLPDDGKNPEHPGWRTLTNIFETKEAFFQDILFLLGYDISSNIYVFTRKALSIFDPGNDYTAYMALFHKHGFSPEDIETIVLSHGHRDHCMGFYELIRSYPAVRKNRNLKLIAHEACPQEIEDVAREFGVSLQKVRGGERVDLGGYELEVIHTPGHTIDGICLYHHPSRTLLSGDIVQPHMMAEPDKSTGGRLDHYLLSIRRLLKKDIRNILPGHGSPTLCSGRRVIEETYESLMMKIIGAENPISWVDGASSLLSRGLLEEALFCLDKWLNCRADDARAMEMKVMCLNDLGRCQEALEVLDRFQPGDGQESRNPFLPISRGYALLGLGRFRESIDHFDKALLIRSDMPEALVYKGMALYLAGDHEQAMQIELFKTEFAERFKEQLAGKSAR